MLETRGGALAGAPLGVSVSRLCVGCGVNCRVKCDFPISAPCSAYSVLCGTVYVYEASNHASWVGSIMDLQTQ